MENLTEHLRSNHFEVPALEINSKIIRFDRGGKKNAWFVGFENKDSKGNSYIIAEYGDWKTGEKHEYRTERKYTKTEKSKICRKLVDTKRIMDAEREKLQEECKAYASDTWEHGADNSKALYLERKKISSLLGCRTQLGAHGRFVMVPMRDVAGVLWGVQKIYPDGSKLFLTGQRIKGLFHIVSGLDECDLALENTIYITEGFATASSLNQALSKPVVVCFSANNLLEVSKILKEKYPAANFVVCADNDQFTTRKNEDGEEVPYNPGIVYGEKAAAACTGTLVYPEFESLAGEPTDFNDLHLLYGLEKVVDAINKKEKVESEYIQCAGHIADEYFYTSSSQTSVLSFSSPSHTKHKLMSLMPLGYWQVMYPGESEGSVEWDLAASSLMKTCREKGIYKKNLSRGSGAWIEDDGSLVISLGDKLWTKGTTVGLKGLSSKYIYEASTNAYLEPLGKALPLGSSQDIVEILSRLSWEKPNSYMFLAGWLAIAPFCGAAPWRPHVWLTGSRGTGKTTIMDDIVGVLLNGYSKRFEGSTTEAGIRQTLGSSAMPVLFDEMETEKGSNRVESIIKMFRSASSRNSGPITKGSSGGTAIEYNTRFGALVSSINVNLQQQQDESRFTVISLKAGVRSFDEYKQLSHDVKILLTDDFCHQFFNRSIKMYDTYLANYELLQTLISVDHGARAGQQYGSLLAGFAILDSDKPISKDHAEFIIEQAKLDEKSEDMTEDVEIDCFNHLMNSMIRLNGAVPVQDITVSEAIKNCYEMHPGNHCSQSDWRKSVSMHGIRVLDDGVFVANRHPQVRKIFSDTVWQEYMWSQHLIKVSGAKKSNTVRFSKEGTSKCVILPTDAVKNTGF